MAEPTKVVYDEAYVSSSLDARVQYLTDFIEFTSDDADALRDAAPLLTPVIPGVRSSRWRDSSRLTLTQGSSSTRQLIDAVYVKLFHYPVTKAVFVERYGVSPPIPSR